METRWPTARRPKRRAASAASHAASTAARASLGRNCPWMRCPEWGSTSTHRSTKSLRGQCGLNAEPHGTDCGTPGHNNTDNPEPNDSSHNDPAPRPRAAPTSNPPPTAAASVGRRSQQTSSTPIGPHRMLITRVRPRRRCGVRPLPQAGASETCRLPSRGVLGAPGCTKARSAHVAEAGSPWPSSTQRHGRLLLRVGRPSGRTLIDLRLCRHRLP